MTSGAGTSGAAATDTTSSPPRALAACTATSPAASVAAMNWSCPGTGPPSGPRGCAALWSAWLPRGWRSRAPWPAPGRTAVPRTPGPPARSPAARPASRRPRSGTGRSAPRCAAWPRRRVRPGRAPGRCRPGAAAHPARTRSGRRRIRSRPTPRRQREPAGAGRQQLGGERGRCARISPQDLLQLPQVVTGARRPGQRQQQPGAQRGCHVMPRASHLVEPPGVTGQRIDKAGASHGHTPTVPWAGAKRLSANARPRAEVHFRVE